MEEIRLTAELGDNNLSFIETSALDASNVELAFQNILTGKSSGVQYTGEANRHDRDLQDRVQQDIRNRRLRAKSDRTRHQTGHWQLTFP